MIHLRNFQTRPLSLSCHLPPQYGCVQCGINAIAHLGSLFDTYRWISMASRPPRGMGEGWMDGFAQDTGREGRCLMKPLQGYEHIPVEDV